MKGYYCNTCKKNHKVGYVCKEPVITQKDLEDKIEVLQREVNYLRNACLIKQGAKPIPEPDRNYDKDWFAETC